MNPNSKSSGFLFYLCSVVVITTELKKFFDILVTKNGQVAQVVEH
jgi:hypothetical protein